MVVITYIFLLARNQNILLQELCRLEKVSEKKSFSVLVLKNRYLFVRYGVREVTLEL